MFKVKLMTFALIYLNIKRAWNLNDNRTEKAVYVSS